MEMYYPRKGGLNLATFIRLGVVTSGITPARGFESEAVIDRSDRFHSITPARGFESYTVTRRRSKDISITPARGFESHPLGLDVRGV